MNNAEDLATPQTVLAFWRAAGPDKWFENDAGFDDAIGPDDRSRSNLRPRIDDRGRVDLRLAH